MNELYDLKVQIQSKDQIIKTTDSELDSSQKEEELLKNQIFELNKCYKHVMESNSILSSENADYAIKLGELRQLHENAQLDLSNTSLQLKY